MAYDAHCHIDFAHTPDGAVERAREAGVRGFCIAGADPRDWDRLRATARRAGAHVAIGLHPWFVATAPDGWRDQLGAALDEEDVDALGELGLDRLRADSDTAFEHQVERFRDQLALARERNRPIVLHSVRTDERVLQILRDDGVPGAGGLIHAFQGGPDHARAFCSLGLHVSFGLRGLRNDRSSPTLIRRAAAAIRAVPPDRRLFETDAPEVQVGDGDASRPAEPADVWRVIRAAARATDTDPNALAAETEANARTLFSRVARPLRPRAS